MPTMVYFERPWMEIFAIFPSHLEFLFPLGYFLLPLGYFLWPVWCIFPHFGLLYQYKSGNPSHAAKKLSNFQFHFK
jgi:hypothetical protein